MALSSFPVAAKSLLPLLAMKTALSVSHVKSTWRSVLQAIAGGVMIAARPEAEARDSVACDEGAAHRTVRVKQFETVRPELSALEDECSCSCCVCLCRFEAEEEVSELNCKHFFHRDCLERWFKNDRRTCPLCRSVL